METSGELEDMIAFLSSYADELEEQAGAPDPVIREKIALLQSIIENRDAVVQETAERMKNGGVVEMLQQLQSMEQAVNTVESNLKDTEVAEFLASSKDRWGGVVVDEKAVETTLLGESLGALTEGQDANGSDEAGNGIGELRLK
jgi:hypothetical protein